MSIKILRRPEVLDRVGVGRTTLYDLIKNEGFPEPRKLGGRAVGWIEEEVNEWIASRARVSYSHKGEAADA
ncbi:MAG: AlpA family transcriptional regulator [Methylothermaceae bacterium]|nr:AlpA family transcriptional regulator [Methylothermaceae bacterium]